jgi:predicted dienelactone hydrolase
LIDLEDFRLRFGLRLPALLVYIACVFVVAPSCPAQQQIREAGLDVVVWLPDAKTTTAPSGEWPVIVFSHGYGGSNRQSTFLMKALADAGYAVFAPNHQDAGFGSSNAKVPLPQAPFRKPNLWTDDTYADRRNDIERLLDGLSHDPRYGKPPYDWQHVGLAGHSLGGYTILGLAGAWPEWKDGRVKAVLALSPYSVPFIARQTLSNITVPVMYQGGTWDVGLTPFIVKPNGAYDQTNAPKYYVEFRGAGHLAWTDLRQTDHAAIAMYSVAFFDHVFKGKPFPQDLNGSQNYLSMIRQQEK